MVNDGNLKIKDFWGTQPNSISLLWKCLFATLHLHLEKIFPLQVEIPNFTGILFPIKVLNFSRCLISLPLRLNSTEFEFLLTYPSA